MIVLSVAARELYNENYAKLVTTHSSHKPKHTRCNWYTFILHVCIRQMSHVPVMWMLSHSGVLWRIAHQRKQPCCISITPHNYLVFNASLSGRSNTVVKENEW